MRGASVSGLLDRGGAAVNAGFSIVIPACNAADFIADTLASVAQADGIEQLDQIIVIDDASRDATSAVARRALDALGLPGVVLRNAHNLGASASRARGFAQARSPLLACVDADDLCTARRFADALRLLADPAIQLVGGDLVMFPDPRFPPAHGTLPFSSDQRIRMPVRGDDIAATLVFHCPVYASTMTFRRRALGAVVVPQARVGEDWLFTHRVVQAFGPRAVANTGSVLMRYRRHARQLTKNAFLDNTPVFPVWDEILRQALGIHASRTELELHAKFSPPSCKPRASRAELLRWRIWRATLERASVAARYVPTAIARALERIETAVRAGVVDAGAVGGSRAAV